MATSDTFSSAFQAGAGKARSHKKGGAFADYLRRSFNVPNDIPILHKGGRVQKTGVHRLKKGELVLTKEQQRECGIRKAPVRKTASRKRLSRKD